MPSGTLISILCRLMTCFTCFKGKLYFDLSWK